MTWYYASGGDRLGPVDDAAFERLIADGTIAPDTLVWRAGMSGWQPLRDLRPAAAPIVVAAPAPLPVPAPVPVPAAPPYVAPEPRVSTIPARPTIDPDITYAQIASSGRRLAVIDAIRRGFALVMAEPGPAVGVTLLVLAAIIATGFVPCLGAIVQICATGPLIAGWQRYFLRRARGLPVTVWEVFEGFSSAQFLQLVLQYVVSFALTMIVALPIFGLMFASMFAAAALEDIGPVVLIGGWTFAILVGVSISVYLSVSWIFSLLLIIDKGLPFWPAMQLSRRVAQRVFFPLVGLLLLHGVIALAGVLALCVGILVAMPVCVASLVYAYEDMFGDAPAS